MLAVLLTDRCNIAVNSSSLATFSGTFMALYRHSCVLLLPMTQRMQSTADTVDTSTVLVRESEYTA